MPNGKLATAINPPLPAIKHTTAVQNGVRFTMLALTSATGKLGSAVLDAILDNDLIDPKELVVCVLLPSPTPQSHRAC